MVAFEPQPEICRGLAAHVRLNQLQAVVRPVMAAVGDREHAAPLIVSATAGESRLAVAADLPVDFRGDHPTHDHTGYTTALPADRNLAGSDPRRPTDVPGVTMTPVLSLDRFCARERLQPDVIKVDVEGWELAVLRGARELIARSPKLALFVELHPSIWPLLGTSRAELLAELEAQQLTIEAIDVPARDHGTGAGADDVWAVEGVCVRLRRRSCAS